MEEVEPGRVQERRDGNGVFRVRPSVGGRKGERGASVTTLKKVSERGHLQDFSF